MSRSATIPKWLWIIALLGVIPFAIPVFIFGPDAVMERLSRRAFESGLWKKSGEPYGVNDMRIKMVDHFMRSQKLAGKSHQEIVGLLGEPDGDPAAKRRFPNWQLHYYLGPSRRTVLFKGFDYDYLYCDLMSEAK
jgi:hypothetical protein